MNILAYRLLGCARLGLRSLDDGLARVQARLRGVRSIPHAWFVVLAVLALAGGCGGAERRARTALDVAAHALVATDAIVAPIYADRAEEAREAALAAHPGPDAADSVRRDYRERMRPLDAVEAALQTSRSLLLAAEAGVDANGADGTWAMLGCVALTLGRLLDALEHAGIDPPRRLAAAIDGLEAVAGGMCETEATAALGAASVAETGGAR